jgi:YD repeat-containing protein
MSVHTVAGKPWLKGTAAPTETPLPATKLVGTTDHDYRPDGRTKAITHKNAAGATIAAYSYDYDTAGRLWTKTEGGVATTYAYDKTGQLTQDGSRTFSYDGTGNRTNAGYVTTAGNRINSDGTWAYTHDAAGQLVKKSKGASAETWTYAYDHRGQMTAASKSATDGGAVQARGEFDYDAFGNRVGYTETNGSGATVADHRYLVDGWDPAKPAAVGTENFDVWADLDAAGNVTTRRVFGAGFDAVTARLGAGGAVGHGVQGGYRCRTDHGRRPGTSGRSGTSAAPHREIIPYGWSEPGP